MQLPEAFVERMRQELGHEQAAHLCEALATEPSTAIRLNPEKLPCPPWTADRVPWSEHGYTLAQRPSFTLDP
jgi:16S rRNA C967 or C1407 C5-methylase (RsmB/RsmF family)